ncbi:TPA: hypothetical protein N0F65_003032 [Lagenidium giganteum]|uniref:Uncharacterized protein n=1 Tax=Lagenidium giganteum TaxID=4803 RepID=A0AAV2YTE0_9STRA|nr:TPA: hypothetical protein N0F65_003032 [Lagenidium giganteum]
MTQQVAVILTTSGSCKAVDPNDVHTRQWMMLRRMGTCKWCATCIAVARKDARPTRWTWLPSAVTSMSFDFCTPIVRKDAQPTLWTSRHMKGILTWSSSSSHGEKKDKPERRWTKQLKMGTWTSCDLWMKSNGRGVRPMPRTEPSQMATLRYLNSCVGTALMGGQTTPCDARHGMGPWKFSNTSISTKRKDVQQKQRTSLPL